MIAKVTWWCLSGKEPAYNAGDVAGALGLIPGSGRAPGEGNGNSLQYSCLGNSMNRGACDTLKVGVIAVMVFLFKN